ncbi:DnaJ domain-containing protein [Candidatus Chlorohelix sp.]|uniref:DnaJ domain-containing protein n=1 Tax=Candidatus Chlorohelix sp. TaxID=3139201 RepID=UPI00302F63D7
MAEVRRRQQIDYYRVLQVDPTAETEVVEAAYKALVKKYHPDRNRAPEAEQRMAQINIAFDVLRDAEKRRDYNQIRDSLDRYNRNPPAQTARPRPTEKPKESASVSRTQEEPPPRTKPRPNYFVEREASHGFNPLPWVIAGMVFLILLTGCLLLLETAFGNPLATSFITTKNPNLPQSGYLVITAPPSTVAPAPVGVLSREGASAFLLTPDLFDRRVLDLTITQPDTMRVTIRLSEKGGTTNAETVATSNKPDALDLLRQSEQTTYVLIYTLYRQYPDLNRLALTLTDPKDEKRQVYRSDTTRNSAFSFFNWRGEVNPRQQSVQDMARFAFEDRFAYHYGAPLDDQTHKIISNPTSENILAEIGAWLPSDGIQVRVEGNGAVNIGYLISKNEQEMKSDWAKIFYALYTRFPYLDRISITKGVVGTSGTEIRVNERSLFNRVTQAGWAQRLFAKGIADPKSLIDSLPNDPSLSFQPPQTIQVEVKPGGSGKGKNWEISDPSRYLLQARIGNLTSERGKFMLLNLKLTNINSVRDWPNVSQLFTLLDGQGYSYRADVIAALAQYLTPPSNAAPYGAIEPGKSFTILLVFDIPDNSSNLRLIMQDDNSSVVLPLN